MLIVCYISHRTLYVAINFFGKRMKKESVVWHGLSSKMLFSQFATYFDCPTSTTTQKNVAQTFSGNGSGIILKLKSFYNENCAWHLDVSLFSDFTDECERLFLNDPLVITDILTIDRKKQKWVSYKKYMGALLFFNKITTGMALDHKWNIRDSLSIQQALVSIITDYYGSMRNNNKKSDDDVPNYIRILFRHYCLKHESPVFNDVDKIQHLMDKKLQTLMFGNVKQSAEEIDPNDFTQKIQHIFVQALFPNATKYKNDQKETILMKSGDTINPLRGGAPSIDQVRQQRSLSKTKR